MDKITVARASLSLNYYHRHLSFNFDFRTKVFGAVWTKAGSGGTVKKIKLFLSPNRREGEEKKIPVFIIFASCAQFFFLSHLFLCCGTPTQKLHPVLFLCRGGIGAVTAVADDYICTGLNINDLSPDDPLWIIKFSAIAQGKEDTVLNSSGSASINIPTYK